MAFLPVIIQGGMGAGVSSWRLARAVSSTGQLGVVSGTALDVILARRLQEGDPGVLRMVQLQRGVMRVLLLHGSPHAAHVGYVDDQCDELRCRAGVHEPDGANHAARRTEARGLLRDRSGGRIWLVHDVPSVPGEIGACALDACERRLTSAKVVLALVSVSTYLLALPVCSLYAIERTLSDTGQRRSAMSPLALSVPDSVVRCHRTCVYALTGVVS